MFWMLIAKPGNLHDRLFEVDRFAERLIIDGVRNDRDLSVVMDIDLHTLEPTLQILDVSLYFAVAGQLIACQVSIM